MLIAKKVNVFGGRFYKVNVFVVNVDAYLYQRVWREHVLKGMGPQERMELMPALF